MSNIDIRTHGPTTLGQLGAGLCKYLSVEEAEVIRSRSLLEQWLEVDRLAARGERLKAAAASLLCCNYPVQVRLMRTELIQLVRPALKPLPAVKLEVDLVERGEIVVAQHGHFYGSRFKLKAHPGATNKVNLFASELLESLRKQHGILWSQLLRYKDYLYMLYDDQVCCVIMQAMNLASYMTDNVEFVLRAIFDVEGCKNINTAIKALGMNNELLGAKLVEMNALQGRAVGSIDLVQETAYRVNATEVAKSVVEFEEGALRKSIRRILALECPRDIEFSDVDEMWSSRWLWAVNGSHSRVLEDEEPDKRVAHDDYSHLYRRAYFERLGTNLLQTWSGVRYFTASQKLELGKSRAIYSIDSASYANFHHLLAPVERAWLGRKVDLNPGRLGAAGLSRRIYRMRKDRPMNVMLDYDDFNSQHSNRTMQIVLDELITHVGYDSVRGKKLVDSVLRSRVFVGGQDQGYLMGTLMSGDRYTSFMNSILNFVYLDLCVEGFFDMNSIHVGDDVYISCRDFGEAQRVMEGVAASKLRMQAIKQSVGSVCGEFLRMCVGQDYTVGYAARSIGSIVCGNWVSETKLGPLEALQSMVGSAWTLFNRTQNPTIVRLLIPAVTRMTRLRKSTVRDLLTGEVGLNDGPLRGRMSCKKAVHVKEILPDESERLLNDASRIRATTEYLGMHVHPSEKKAMQRTGSDVKSAMINASYRKTCMGKTEDGRSSELFVSHVSNNLIAGGTTVEALLDAETEVGVLSQYPLLQLMKGSLSRDLLRELIEDEGIIPARNLEVQAWGGEARGIIVSGYLSYSDACNLSKRTTADVVSVTRQTLC